MTAIVIQARMSSSRLPGKVMADILGQPMILRQLERVRRSRRATDLLVVTSTDSSDDPLATLLNQAGVSCLRGPLNDVLARYLAAADRFGFGTLVRLTADCPLVDASVIDRVIDVHDSSAADYASNVLERSYPRGLDVEAVTVDALRKVSIDATAEEREHVTLGVYRHPERFTLESVTQQSDESSWRWTVDVREDLTFVRWVYQALYPANPAFTPDDVRALIAANPHRARFESDMSG